MLVGVKKTGLLTERGKINFLGQKYVTFKTWTKIEKPIKNIFAKCVDNLTKKSKTHMSDACLTDV